MFKEDYLSGLKEEDEEEYKEEDEKEVEDKEEDEKAGMKKRIRTPVRGISDVERRNNSSG